MIRGAKQLKLLKKYGAWAVVTGSTSGIGRELCISLAKSGFNVFMVGRNIDALETLAEELAIYEVERQFLSIDLSESDSLTELEAVTDNLDVGLFIASAGFGTSGKFVNSNLQTELNMLNVNCRSLLELTHLFSKRFAAQHRGGIILMSSIVGFQGMPFAAHYAATKAYVQTLAEALSFEFAPLGVDVLAAAPGPTVTNFGARAGMKMGNALTAKEIAQPILDALGNKTTALPGFLSKLLVYSLVPLPRWARIRIMGSVMQGMISEN